MVCHRPGQLLTDVPLLFGILAIYWHLLYTPFTEPYHFVHSALLTNTKCISHTDLGPILLIKINNDLDRDRDIYIFIWDAITHACHNFNGALTKLQVRVWMNNYPESFCVDVITYPCHNPDAGLTNLCQEICSVNNLRRTNAGELYNMQLNI